MITVFTAVKYEIEIECFTSILVSAFSKRGQSFQYYMQNISGMQEKKQKTRVKFYTFPSVVK